MYEWGYLKSKAKRGLYDNYLLLVLMGLLFTVISMIGSGSSLSSALLRYKFSMPVGVEQFLRWAKGNGSLVLLLFNVFIGSAAWLAQARVGLRAYRGGAPDSEDLLLAFREGRYLRTVGAYALCVLFISVGFMLLIIPGVIVACGLSQAPFLLAEDPALKPMDAIRVSWELMRGRKGDYFLFVLSFIGWILLGLVTFGVVMALFTGPYMRNALAGYHDKLCAEYDMRQE